MKHRKKTFQFLSNPLIPISQQLILFNMLQKKFGLSAVMDIYTITSSERDQTASKIKVFIYIQKASDFENCPPLQNAATT